MRADASWTATHRATRLRRGLPQGPRWALPVLAGLLWPAVLVAPAGPLRPAGALGAARPGEAHPAAAASGAVALLNRAFADARATGAFRQTIVQVYGSTRGTLENDVALTTGRQLITSADGTRAEVRVIGRTAYVAGNTYALRSYFKFAAGQVAAIGSNWVSIPSTNGAYTPVAYDVTVPTALTAVAPTGRLTAGAATTVDGRRLVAISGSAPSIYSGAGRATIYITAGRDPLPVRVTIDVSKPPYPKVSVTGSMGHWGERVPVSRPAGALPIAELPALARRLAALAIPGAPGYYTFTGPHGLPAASGRPWGRACRPIVLHFGPSLPAWITRPASLVVEQARRQGIDVAWADATGRAPNPSLYYRAGQSRRSIAVVPLLATDAAPPALPGGAPAPSRFSWNMRVDAGGRSEALTQVSAELELRVLTGHPALVRRTIRQLIAWTQGVGRATATDSGIADNPGVDAFSHADLAAMLGMSGCAKPAPGTVTGIAAGATGTSR